MATASDIREIVGRAAASLGYSQLKPEQEQAILAFVSGMYLLLYLPAMGKGGCLFTQSHVVPP